MTADDRSSPTEKAVSIALAGIRQFEKEPENYVFRNAAHDSIQAPMIVEEAVGRRGFKKVAILADSTNYGQLGREDLEKALKAKGITPVVCVGETLAEREAGQTEAVVKRQLAAVIQHVGHCVSELVVAYEPVWAIGTGKTASPEQAQQVHAVLRAQLAAATQQADRVPLLYGGSMNAANAAQLLAQPDIDGGLIGGASLKAADFLQIIAAAQ